MEQNLYSLFAQLTTLSNHTVRKIQIIALKLSKRHRHHKQGHLRFLLLNLLFNHFRSFSLWGLTCFGNQPQVDILRSTLFGTSAYLQIFQTHKLLIVFVYIAHYICK